MNILIVLLPFIHAHSTEKVKLTPEQKLEQCILVDPDLFYYSVPKRVITLFLVLLVSIVATVLPLLYRTYFKKPTERTNLVLTLLKLFGTGVLIATAFIHMLPPAVEILANPCLPDVFQDYVNWPGTIFLFGFLITHLLQQLANDITRFHEFDQESHGHVHHLSLTKRENSIVAHALEFGLCSHSIVVGFTLGTIEKDFTPLFYAILVHQFFEGLALSSIIVEACLSNNKTALMILFYSFSTPVGVFLGILFRSYNTESNAIQIAIGFSESFCAGVLAHDSIGNLMSLHFFGEYYRDSERKDRYLHILALWGGVITMTIMGIWA